MTAMDRAPDEPTLRWLCGACLMLASQCGGGREEGELEEREIRDLLGNDDREH